MPESNTPTEDNQLRKGRAVALLIHYKNRLLGERGLPDEDTLTDLLTDLCHAHTPAEVGEALCWAHTHHHAEIFATEDDPHGDAAAVRYAAIREAALRKFAADGIDSDESPVLAFPDNPADNGVSVQTWTWFSFIGTPFAFQATDSLPVTQDEGDDLCDQCMSSGVQVARTDDAGNTLCTECDSTPVSPATDKDVWCIFHRCPEGEPAWHDESGLPVTFPTKHAAELEIIDTLEELFQQVKAGERELEDVWGDEDWIEPVRLHADGTITTEGGTTYGRRDDYNEP